ncbi:MAG: GYD domain-containing protein [Bacteroidota bacterium]|nr:GYD domain-containing protein [Bacteroidota bacterium]
MKKFLIKASYTAEGVKGLLKVGGTNRKQAVEKMIVSLGGKMEAFYYAFGDHDVYAIGEVPDDASLAALALTINASGLVSISTTILLSPEEIDKATKVSVDYRSPGN